MNYDIICIGSALLDIYMKSSAFKKVATDGAVAMCETYGGKTEVSAMVMVSGGAGTNTAVSFARKGYKTALVAEVGKDLAAAAIKEELYVEGVDYSMIRQEEGEETGVSSILVAEDGGRSAMIYRGASRMLTKEDIEWEKLRASWLYISSLGGEMALLEGLIGHAKAYGIAVAVNPGMAEIGKLADWGGTRLFEGVRVLLMNREEAEAMLKTGLGDEAVWRSDWQVPGPEITVITDGKNGGRVSQGTEVFWYESMPVLAVEETGAGDAFGSGLVAAIMAGKDIREAVEWGKRQAASVVTYMGAKRGLLPIDAIAS